MGVAPSACVTAITPWRRSEGALPGGRIAGRRPEAGSAAAPLGASVGGRGAASSPALAATGEGSGALTAGRAPEGAGPGGSTERRLPEGGSLAAAVGRSGGASAGARSARLPPAGEALPAWPSGALFAGSAGWASAVPLEGDAPGLTTAGRSPEALALRVASVAGDALGLATVGRSPEAPAAAPLGVVERRDLVAAGLASAGRSFAALAAAPPVEREAPGLTTAGRSPEAPGALVTPGLGGWGASRSPDGEALGRALARSAGVEPGLGGGGAVWLPLRAGVLVLGGVASRLPFLSTGALFGVAERGALGLSALALGEGSLAGAGTLLGLGGGGAGLLLFVTAAPW